jgi:hypothetical protein
MFQRRSNLNNLLENSQGSIKVPELDQMDEIPMKAIPSKH